MKSIKLSANKDIKNKAWNVKFINLSTNKDNYEECEIYTVISQ